VAGAAAAAAAHWRAQEPAGGAGSPLGRDAAALAGELDTALDLGASASASAASAAPAAPRGGAAPLAELIWHPSDMAVKPIVGNRRIERLPDPRYEARELPFRPLSLAEMLATDQRDLETFLTDIYRWGVGCGWGVWLGLVVVVAAAACGGGGWGRLCVGRGRQLRRGVAGGRGSAARMAPAPGGLLCTNLPTPSPPPTTTLCRAIASSAPIKDKTNVLCYFETLCCDTAAANILINSSLTILFIRMLKNAKAGPLRVKLASVLGERAPCACPGAPACTRACLLERLPARLPDQQAVLMRRSWHPRLAPRPPKPSILPTPTPPPPLTHPHPHTLPGLMVRHTTYITEELAGTGVVDALAEALRDKSERVRRRAMATLGGRRALLARPACWPRLPACLPASCCHTTAGSPPPPPTPLHTTC
jgi:hypothetical protein